MQTYYQCAEQQSVRRAAIPGVTTGDKAETEVCDNGLNMSDLYNSVSGVVPDDNTYQLHTRAQPARYDARETEPNDVNQEGVQKSQTKSYNKLPSEYYYAYSKDYDTLLQENGVLRKQLSDFKTVSVLKSLDYTNDADAQEHFYKEQFYLLNRELYLKHEYLKDLSYKYLALLQETKANELKSTTYNTTASHEAELGRVTQQLRSATQSISAKENQIRRLEEEVSRLKTALNQPRIFREIQSTQIRPNDKTSVRVCGELSQARTGTSNDLGQLKYQLLKKDEDINAYRDRISYLRNDVQSYKYLAQQYVTQIQKAADEKRNYESQISELYFYIKRLSIQATEQQLKLQEYQNNYYKLQMGARDSSATERTQNAALQRQNKMLLDERDALADKCEQIKQTLDETKKYLAERNTYITSMEANQFYYIEERQKYYRQVDSYAAEIQKLRTENDSMKYASQKVNDINRDLLAQCQQQEKEISSAGLYLEYQNRDIEILRNQKELSEKSAEKTQIELDAKQYFIEELKQYILNLQNDLELIRSAHTTESDNVNVGLYTIPIVSEYPHRVSELEKENERLVESNYSAKIRIQTLENTLSEVRSQALNSNVATEKIRYRLQSFEKSTHVYYQKLVRLQQLKTKRELSKQISGLTGLLDSEKQRTKESEMKVTELQRYIDEKYLKVATLSEQLEYLQTYMHASADTLLQSVEKDQMYEQQISLANSSIIQFKSSASELQSKLDIKQNQLNYLKAAAKNTLSEYQELHKANVQLKEKIEKTETYLEEKQNIIDYQSAQIASYTEQLKALQLQIADQQHGAELLKVQHKSEIELQLGVVKTHERTIRNLEDQQKQHLNTIEEQKYKISVLENTVQYSSLIQKQRQQEYEVRFENSESIHKQQLEYLQNLQKDTLAYLEKARYMCDANSVSLADAQAKIAYYSATLLAREKQIDAQNAVISELNYIKSVHYTLDREHAILKRNYDNLKSAFDSLSAEHDALGKKLQSETSQHDAHTDALTQQIDQSARQLAEYKRVVAQLSEKNDNLEQKLYNIYQYSYNVEQYTRYLYVQLYHSAENTTRLEKDLQDKDYLIHKYNTDMSAYQERIRELEKQLASESQSAQNHLTHLVQLEQRIEKYVAEQKYWQQYLFAVAQENTVMKQKLLDNDRELKDAKAEVARITKHNEQIRQSGEAREQTIKKEKEALAEQLTQMQMYAQQTQSHASYVKADLDEKLYSMQLTIRQLNAELSIKAYETSALAAQHYNIQQYYNAKISALEAELRTVYQSAAEFRAQHYIALSENNRLVALLEKQYNSEDGVSYNRQSCKKSQEHEQDYTSDARNEQLLEYSKIITRAQEQYESLYQESRMTSREYYQKIDALESIRNYTVAEKHQLEMQLAETKSLLGNSQRNVQLLQQKQEKSVKIEHSYMLKLQKQKACIYQYSEEKEQLARTVNDYQLYIQALVAQNYLLTEKTMREEEKSVHEAVNAYNGYSVSNDSQYYERALYNSDSSELTGLHSKIYLQVSENGRLIDVAQQQQAAMTQTIASLNTQSMLSRIPGDVDVQTSPANAPAEQLPKNYKETVSSSSNDLIIDDLKDIKSLAQNVILESSALTQKINEYHQYIEKQYQQLEGMQQSAYAENAK